VWRQADKYKVPRMCFINKLDRTGADFWKAVASIHDRLTKETVIVTLPMGVEEDFAGIIDLVSQKAVYFEGEMGLQVEEREIPAEYQADAAKHREALIERVSGADDALTEKYITGEAISEAELKAGLRRAVIATKLIPIFCGTALKNKGVQRVLDGIVDYLPSPVDVPPVIGVNPDKPEEKLERKADVTEPFSALAFKVATDPYVGQITFFRVYSGKISAGSYMFNSSTGKKERISRILRMHANQREEVDEMSAGEIGALVGMKYTTTGDTLCDADHAILLERIIGQEPVISIAVEPKTKADQEKMGMALKSLQAEDPTFRVKTDEETLQTIMQGMGELHLEIIVDRMKREFGVQVNVGKPQVAYRETIKETVEAEGKYIKQSGGRGQYGHVWLRLEPLEPGGGVQFEDDVKGGTIPKEFITPIEKGVMEAAQNGVLAGYPVVDIKAVAYDGSYHDVDSSEMAFKIAGSMAFRSGVTRGKPVLLEPIMKVEVTTPENYMGDVVGDLNSRRGQIDGIEDRPMVKVIRALVPLAEMFGYATQVRSMTQGRAVYSMEYDHYQEVPRNVQETIVGQRQTSGTTRQGGR
jgi:elongation factor G